MGVGEGEYRRRAPEKSVLHEAFRRGFAEVSEWLPARVKREVVSYLRCGDVRYGFVEVTCDGCRESRLVAFSCKGRGWCPSCTTRRAIETGALVEALVPRVAHRQWTLSVPFSVRVAVVKQPGLLKRLEVWLVKAVWHAQRVKARRLGAKGRLTGGGVCFWQWFGSRLQLTPHLHLLVPEAVWTSAGDAVEVPAPDDAEVLGILQRVLRRAAKHWPDDVTAWAEDEYQAMQHEAVQSTLGLHDAPTPVARRKHLVAVAHGFSLHAGTAVHGNDRAGLERLARYGARGPVAECRLTRLDDGRYQYTPKKGHSFVVTAEDLVRRLVALAPPPRRHLTSFHGVYAPNARLRPHVTRRPDVPESTPTPTKKPKTKRRLDWATLHQHTFGTDVLRCPTCGGRRRLRALFATWAKAEARLAKLGVTLPSRLLPQATAPPQLPLAFV